MACVVSSGKENTGTLGQMRLVSSPHHCCCAYSTVFLEVFVVNISAMFHQPHYNPVICPADFFLFLQLEIISLVHALLICISRACTRENVSASNLNFFQIICKHNGNHTNAGGGCSEEHNI